MVFQVIDFLAKQYYLERTSANKVSFDLSNKKSIVAEIVLSHSVAAALHIDRWQLPFGSINHNEKLTTL
jgi:hypothetical protein